MTDTNPMTTVDEAAEARVEAELSAAEDRQRRIWDMRARGMTFTAIGQIFGMSRQLVAYHFKQARLAHIRDLDENGWKEKAGEHVRKLTRAQEVCLSHLSALEQGELDDKGKPKPGTSKKGSIQAAIWMQTYLRAVKDEKEFQLDVGFFPRAKEQLEVTFKDARSMSLEELQNECASLEAHLSRVRVVPDRHREAKRITQTIDAQAKLVETTRKNGEPKIEAPSPDAVAKAAARIEKRAM